MRCPNGENTGEVHVRVRLSNAGDVERVHRGLATTDQVRSCEVDALVDTGSTRSVIPAEIVASLGLTLVDTAVGRVGDGCSVSVGISSAVGFEILGRRTFEEAYVMGKEILMGQTTPEATDLLVDCKDQKVIGKHAEGPIFRL
jgi:predicted aspartyl protease